MLAAGARAGKSVAVAGGGPTAPPARLESSAKVGWRSGDRARRGFQGWASKAGVTWPKSLRWTPGWLASTEGCGVRLRARSAQRPRALVAAAQAAQTCHGARSSSSSGHVLVDGRGLRARRTPRVWWPGGGRSRGVRFGCSCQVFAAAAGGGPTERGGSGVLANGGSAEHLYLGTRNSKRPVFRSPWSGSDGW